ncbi:hypothetical protein J2Z40_003786 [Cytobacillus eiseniae]|uniref:DUF3221 domain-containing protein n=1 Tax=Cytobacillus eiseniae TaxID=762947 RepID=A0ABS4RJZ0_9BACI|nr:hypothetical protein [Cytobacillus eiseniae]MBP2243198.1 hypothetical protein [Cytobacillus eiseniae]
MVILYIFLILLIVGCSDNEELENLNAKDFNNVVVLLNGSKVYESNKDEAIEGIINEININKKEFATEMSFGKEPEGKIKFTGKKDIEISFFEETGRSIYGHYYIHTEFKFE